MCFMVDWRGGLGLRNCCWGKNLGVIRWDSMAFCGRQLYYCFVFFVLVVLVLHTTKPWRGSYFFWLFVTMMRGWQDGEACLRGLLSANAASAESGDQPEVVKWFC